MRDETKPKKVKRGPNKGNRSGRKGLCTREVIEKAAVAAKAGALDNEIANVIGIHPGTLSEWKTTYPEFADALKLAREKPIKAVEAALYRSAMGYTFVEEKLFFFKGKLRREKVVKHYPPNPTSLIFFLKNKAPKDWRDILAANNSPDLPSGPEGKLSYPQFCAKAGYPAPYPKQIEMYEFGMQGGVARLLLGARGYGKTDYVVILGIAYQIYIDPKYTSLIVTKSDERNAAMLKEIEKAAEANGVVFEKANGSCLRVRGLLGKDHSVSTVTVGTSSLRGRHPKLVVMDDPVTEEDVSEATRKKVQRVYNELSKLTGNVLVIGQPVHKADLYGSLRPLLKKMEVTHGTIPELDHDLEAQRLAGVSENSIQASYFLKVTSETGFPLENCKLIDSFPVGDSIAFIDPAFGSATGGGSGDFTALTILKGHFDGVAVQGHLYKRAWNHCLPEMIQAMNAAQVRRLGFETNSLGDMPLTILREALPNIGVVGKHSTKVKHSRIMNAGAYSHLIHLSKTSDRAYIEQVINYEYGAKNDDAPDSLASCLELVGLIRGAKV